MHNAYDANPYVYGTTAAGSKVVLGGNVVKGIYVDSTDFTVDPKGNGTGGGTMTRLPNGFDNIYVAANTLASNVTASSTNLTVTVLGADGLVHSLTTPIKSTTASSVAASIGCYVDTTQAGIAVNDTGDIATVTLGSTGAAGLASGKNMARFDQNGAKANRASFTSMLKISIPQKQCH